MIFACSFVRKTRTSRVTFFEQSRAQGMSLAVRPSREHSWLTFFPCGEEFLAGVIEPDPKGGGAYLSLEASRQPAVELHGPFCSGQSGDGSQDAFIPDGTRGLAFTLDLERRKIQVRGE